MGGEGAESCDIGGSSPYHLSMGARLLTIVLALAVAGGAWVSAALLTRPLNQQRADLQLTVADINDALPADAVLTNALLGTFRGMAVMALWQRAEFLKNEGRYNEVMQLTDLITTLQPKYPKVWEYASWNTSYNVSVGTHTWQERWMWVQNGIDQLRDKGIQYNPESLALYKQLSWIFLHKVQGFQDDFNQYYKRELASEWDQLLGGAVPTTSYEAYAERLRPIAEAPDTLEEALAGKPRAEGVLEWFKSNGFGQTRESLTRFVRRQAYEWSDFHPEDESEPHLHLEEEAEPESDETGLTEAEIAGGSEALRKRFEYANWPSWIPDETRDALMAWARKEVLTGSPYNMDPQYMLELGERYEPIDWRHPASHGLYWASFGVDKVWSQYEDRDEMPEDLINSQRNIILATQQLKEKGTITFDPRLGDYGQTSDLPWGFAYLKAVDLAQERFGDRIGDVDAYYGNGLRNFTDGVMVDMYMVGAVEEAEQLKAEMAERFADTPYADRYNVSLEEFLSLDLEDTLENPERTASVVTSLLMNAVIRGLGEGRVQAANRNIATAKRVYDAFKEEYAGMPVSQEVPPFETMLDTAAANVLVNPEFGVTLETRMLVWKNLDADRKARLWPFLAPELAQMSEAYGVEFTTAFTAPTGARSLDELLAEREEQFRQQQQEAENMKQAPLPEAGTIRRQ